MNPSGGRRPLRRGQVYLLAAIAPATVVGALLLPGRERLRAAGPANTGHETLGCAQCHTPAEGTLRQQLQANARSLVGLRETGAAFLHAPVSNGDCLSCHTNPDDRHPAYRFEEPRFDEVRATLAPQRCVSCHAEHTGRRVTTEATVCSSCHTDIEIREDPIDPGHAQLAAEKRWATCLQCHDFHGNHVRTTPLELEAALPVESVERYLSGGPPIYGEDVRFPAKHERPIP